MTLELKLDLDIMVIYFYTKNDVNKTDTRTDMCQNLYLPALVGGNKQINCIMSHNLTCRLYITLVNAQLVHCDCISSANLSGS